jgi:hypothetical protein
MTEPPYGYREFNGGMVPNELEQSTLFWIKSVRNKFPSDKALADALNQMTMLRRGENWTAESIAEVTRINRP